MRLGLETGEGNFIRGYREGAVVVNDRTIEANSVILPETIVEWGPEDFDALEQAHFDALLAHKPELVLLGTGGRQRFPHPRLTRSLLERGIGVEAMATDAACRTYNIVMAEGRRVAAALLLR